MEVLQETKSGNYKKRLGEFRLEKAGMMRVVLADRLHHLSHRQQPYSRPNKMTFMMQHSVLSNLFNNSNLNVGHSLPNNSNLHKEE